MIPSNRPQPDTPTVFRLSQFWDIYIPITIAAIPAGIFLVMGLIIRGWEELPADLPMWWIGIFIGTEIVGIIAMAMVALIRLDYGRYQLCISTKGCVPVWRKLALYSSIMSLVLFDLLTNIATAFGEAFLLVGAAPAFVSYLLCIRIAFANL